MKFMRKSPLRGGIYHIALIVICVSAFNAGVLKLIGVNILGRIFAGVSINETVIAAALAVSAVLVLWNNWVD